MGEGVVERARLGLGRAARSVPRWVGALAPALLVVGAAAAQADEGVQPGRPAPGDARVVVVQDSNGFPGGEQASSGLSRQLVHVLGPRLRVLDQDHGWALYVDTEGRQVREVAIPRREVVTRPFQYFEGYRAKRAEAIAQQAAEFARLRERAGDDRGRVRELERDYTHAGGDPRSPGAIKARLEVFPQDQATATVLIDGAPRELKLLHVKIRENNARDPAFDLWVAPTLQLPVDLLRFWRDLGTFAPEVTAKLAEVPGTPIRCTAVLDTGTFRRTFVSLVHEVRLEQPVSAADVTTPPGLTEVDPDKKPQGPQAGPVRVLCAMTGVELDPSKAVVVNLGRGRRYHVADRAQEKRLYELLDRGEEPPFGGRGGGR